MRTRTPSSDRPPSRLAGPLGSALLWAALPAVTVLLAVVGVVLATGSSMGVLLRDATVTAELPPWTGSLSALTVLLWVAGATVALTAAAESVPGPWRDHARRLGLLALLLGLDDQYLLHDDLAPRAGVPQLAVVLTEGVLVLVVVVAARRVLLRSADTVVLVLALALLALSAGIDVVAELLPEQWQGVRLLAEDGAKLVGVAVLFRYQVLLGRTARAAGRP